MKKFFKSVLSRGIGIFLFGVLFLIVGALLIVFPKDALPYAVLAIGIITILYGIVEIILTLTKKKDIKYFAKLLCAAAALFCGIFLIVERNGNAVSILAFFIGATIIIDGAFKMHSVVSSGRIENAAKRVVVVLSIISIVGGFIIVKFPPENVKACSVIVGLLTIIDGFMNVFSVFCPAFGDKTLLSPEVKGEKSDKGDENLTKEQENS